MKFIFLRHCETEWSATRRLQGQTDVELNQSGRTQAEWLAEKIIAHRPALTVSSDLKRAQETAVAIASKLGIEIRYDSRLRECFFGELEGKTWEEAESHFGIKKRNVWRGARYPYDFTPYGGESRKEVLRRHRDLFDELVSWEYACILVVGHGVGLSTLLADLGETELANTGDIRTIQHPS